MAYNYKAYMAGNRKAYAKNEKLGKNFVPGPFDVICNRGKEYYHHSGNRRFRHIIEANVERYVNASSRVDRSVIVLEIVQAIRVACKEKGGGFIKRDNKTGEWMEIGDSQARDKTGHAIRLCLQKRAKKGETAKNPSTSKVRVMNTSEEGPDDNTESISSTFTSSLGSSLRSITSNATAAGAEAAEDADADAEADTYKSLPIYESLSFEAGDLVPSFSQGFPSSLQFSSSPSSSSSSLTSMTDKTTSLSITQQDRCTLNRQNQMAAFTSDNGQIEQKAHREAVAAAVAQDATLYEPQPIKLLNDGDNNFVDGSLNNSAIDNNDKDTEDHFDDLIVSFFNKWGGGAI